MQELKNISFNYLEIFCLLLMASNRHGEAAKVRMAKTLKLLWMNSFYKHLQEQAGRHLKNRHCGQLWQLSLVYFLSMSHPLERNEHFSYKTNKQKY